MSKPFDNTLNTLIDGTAADWAAFLAGVVGIPPGPLLDYDPIRDGNLSTTAYADKVFRLGGPTPAFLHLELQSGSELELPKRMQLYNTVLRRRHESPVYSILLLLRPSAAASDQTGQLLDLGVNGELVNDFRYTVLRVWERPADDWLNAGVGLLPLALLTNEAFARLPTVAGRFHDRLSAAPVTDKVKSDILSSAFVLGGLRYNRTDLVEVFTNMSLTLEDSTTYQWILEKGYTKGHTLGEAVGLALGEARGQALGEARGRAQTILRQGIKKFGPPDTAVAERLAALADVEHLDRIADRIFDAVSWADLLGTP